MTLINNYEEQIEDSTDEQDESGAAIRCLIMNYGADFPVDAIVNKMNQEDIFIPSFQRNFVWSVSQASRFVESLLLGLPVPGVFLFKDPESNRLMVVDGQQRLRTLQAFYKGVFDGHPFRLIGVASRARWQDVRRVGPYGPTAS